MEEGEIKEKQRARSTRLKARLERLREHQNKCLSRHMEREKQQTQPSGGSNQEWETSSLPELPFEQFSDSKSLEISQDSESYTEIFTPESSHSGPTEDPDVPPLRRTDSILITKEYRESNPHLSDGSESSMSSIEISDDEYIPPKNSPRGSSSEGSYDLTSNVPMVKLKKQMKSQRTSRGKTCPGTSSGKDNRREKSENADDTKMGKTKKQKTQRTSKRKTLLSISSDEDNRGAESENSGDTKMGNVAVLKMQKKKDGSRIYNKPQYCLYCPVHCHKMARHLLHKHSNETAVAQAASFPLNSKERKLHFDLIRNKGNHAHNNEVLKTGRGTLIPSRQSAKAVKASDYMHCINCEALLKRKGIWNHMSSCKFSRKCSEPKPEEVLEAVDSNLSKREADSSFCSSSPGPTRSKRRESTPDEFGYDSAPTGIPQTSDGPETGPPRSNRGRWTSAEPGSVEPAATGSSRSKERQRLESDSGEPETGPSTLKRKQETVESDSGDL